MRQKGFNLIELTIYMVILGILSAYLVVKFYYSSSDARQKSTNSVAAALTTSSAKNYLLKKTGSASVVAVSNCTQVPNTLSSGTLPTGFVVTSQAISSGARVTCTLTHPNGSPTA